MKEQNKENYQNFQKIFILNSIELLFEFIGADDIDNKILKLKSLGNLEQ